MVGDIMEFEAVFRHWGLMYLSILPGRIISNGKEFLRISMGIGRPDSRDPETVSSYVLSDMPSDELEVVREQTVGAILAHVQAHLRT